MICYSDMHTHTSLAFDHIFLEIRLNSVSAGAGVFFENIYEKLCNLYLWDIQNFCFSCIDIHAEVRGGHLK